MSTIGLIIPERTRDIGDFIVGRLLPFRKKRMVGPFIFIDHIGPTSIGPGRYQDIRQHPHIGLSTLTYLFEGQIVHRDTLGTMQLVTPGSVGWMTAGSGIVHTERTPEAQRNGSEYPVHGFQIWVALPKDKEDIAPSFSYTEAEDLPSWQEGEIDFRLVAGTGFQRTSPVPVFSELFMVELKAKKRSVFDIEDNLQGEVGVCVVDGYIEACGQRIEKGHLLVAKQENACQIVMGEQAHVLLFGGAPFPEERYIDWNFVSTSKEKIKAAKERWRNRAFAMVPGEVGYIPLPER